MLPCPYRLLKHTRCQFKTYFPHFILVTERKRCTVSGFLYFFFFFYHEILSFFNLNFVSFFHVFSSSLKDRLWFPAQYILDGSSQVSGSKYTVYWVVHHHPWRTLPVWCTTQASPNLLYVPLSAAVLDQFVPEDFLNWSPSRSLTAVVPLAVPWSLFRQPEYTSVITFPHMPYPYVCSFVTGARIYRSFSGEAMTKWLVRGFGDSEDLRQSPSNSWLIFACRLVMWTSSYCTHSFKPWNIVEVRSVSKRYHYKGNNNKIQSARAPRNCSLTKGKKCSLVSSN